MPHLRGDCLGFYKIDPEDDAVFCSPYCIEHWKARVEIEHLNKRIAELEKENAELNRMVNAACEHVVNNRRSCGVCFWKPGEGKSITECPAVVGRDCVRIARKALRRFAGLEGK